MDDNLLETIDYKSQPSALKDLDKSGEVALRPADMKRQPLHIPEILQPVSGDFSSGEVHYKITAQKGDTEILPGKKTSTYGYNNGFFGPAMKLRKGQHVTIDTKNDIDLDTTYHWHGLMVPDTADGGPMQTLKPGESNTVHFEVKNEAGSYWFHPHPHYISSKQIYKGLTGFIINEDENSERLKDKLPHHYGVDDIPLVIWDRFFQDDGDFAFEDVFGSDGNRGDTLLLNGTAMPKLTATNRYLRLRILNAANVTNFRIGLSDGTAMYQIATDGGFLNYPVGTDRVVLSPAERAEFVIDLQDVEEDRIFLMMNEFEALQIDIEDKKEAADFSPNLSLRKDTLPIIEVKDICGLPSKLFMYSGTDENVTINNKKFDMDRVDEYQPKDAQYVWRVINAENEGSGMVHNFHVHGTQFRVIARDGKIPPKNEMGYKDTVVTSPGETVHILTSFPIVSMYMYHCHNFAHENNGMMGHVQVTAAEEQSG